MNEQTTVSGWPRISVAILGHPGAQGAITATLSVNGARSACAAPDWPTLRAGVIYRCGTIARTLGRPVALEIAEGNRPPYQLAVRINGVVQPLPQNRVLPTADGLTLMEGNCRSCHAIVTVGDDECPTCSTPEPLRVETVPLPTHIPKLDTAEVFPAGTTEQPSTEVAPPQPDHFKPAPPSRAPLQISELPAEEAEHTVVVARKPARPVLYLEGPDGQMLAHIASDALVGRSPRPTEQRVAVQLESPGRELSREHLTIDLDAGHQIIVTDQGASNGVGITLPGETVVHWLTAFTPTIVPPGSVLTMGDVLAQIRF